ncbi:MAG: OmpH family outer membrane protein [Crocinitomicaceae bacterium]|nr:OmpH family outer membrane protein [Crocinitomicaceae bacterium]
MNRIKDIILFTGVIVAIILAVMANSQNNDIAFFDYNRVYNECNLKIELENDLKTVSSSRQSELDSLQMELSFFSDKISKRTSSEEETMKFEELRNRYLGLKQRYEEENLRLKENYFTQIRQSINEQSKDFAKEIDVDYFFAAVGDGSLMYADDVEDMTAELILFVNSNN